MSIVDNLNNPDKSTQEIIGVVENYFQGTYQGSAELLQKAFHPDAHITGNFDGNYVDFSLPDFIARVQAAEQAGENKQYDKKIVSLEIESDIAMAKTKVLVGDAYFMDLITLINIKGEWKIRNKSFTNNFGN